MDHVLQTVSIDLYAGKVAQLNTLYTVQNVQYS